MKGSAKPKRTKNKGKNKSNKKVGDVTVLRKLEEQVQGQNQGQKVRTVDGEESERVDKNAERRCDVIVARGGVEERIRKKVV